MQRHLAVICFCHLLFLAEIWLAKKWASQSNPFRQFQAYRIYEHIYYFIRCF